MAVSSMPAKIPKTGLLNIVRILANTGLSLSGSTAALICSIPTIRTAKPINIVARFRFFSVLKNINKIIPTKAKIAEKDSGLRSFIMKLSPCMPDKLNIHDVTVVPRFAPIITPTPCLSFIIPELMKPTTITVVADED